MPANLRWELIVVDNNSGDDTKNIIDRFKGDSGLLVRYLFEREQGLSTARNRGLDNAEGKIIVFTDDDVIVEPDWLHNIWNAFNEYDVSCIGGRILPLWEKPPPQWLKPQLYGQLALLDYGNKPLFLNHARLWGANLSVRTAKFRQYGKFSTEFGRVGKKLYAGEETEFLNRLLAAGENVLYHPYIVVHHCVSVERLAKSYFRKWEFDNGVNQGIALGHYHHRNLMGVPLFLFRQCFKSALTYARSLLFRSKERFVHELKLLRNTGFIVGRLQFRDKTSSIREGR